MGRACTICTHTQRPAIDRALLAGEMPNRRIATRFDVTEQAVRRHKADHIPQHVARAHEAQAVADADDLLGQVQDLRRRALAILDTAEAAGDYRTALMGIREARACVELLLEVEGELDRRGVTNIVVSPQWLQVRAVLMVALLDHPAARQAVAAALGGIEKAPPVEGGGSGHGDGA